MSQERLKDPDAQQLIELAIVSMKSAIAGFHDFPNSENLMTVALQVWTDVYSNEELKLKIEMEFRQKRMVLNQFGTLDVEKDGDPVRRRYDPYRWQDKIPKEFEHNLGGYVLERSESLLQFLESFNKPQQT